MAKGPIPERACEECGVTYQPRSRLSKRRFCSTRCGYAAKTRTRRHLLRLAAAAAGEDFTLLDIARRDGWRCHLCKRRVTRSDWSMDHLVPLSEGGSHTRDNVALAHLRCNSRRGARPLTAELIEEFVDAGTATGPDRSSCSGGPGDGQGLDRHRSAAGSAARPGATSTA